jgi:serine/threonine-protein kinase
MVGDYGQVYLMDWGSARLTTDGPFLDEHGEACVIGTPSYMAPEQALALAFDERTDVFGLGALLYTVLCGDIPYRSGTTYQCIEAAARGERTHIRRAAADAPAALRTIVRKAMQTKREDRFPNVAAIRDALVAWQRGQLDFPRVLVEAGDLLLRQGDPSDCIYIVRAGWFEVFQTRSGQVRVLRQVGPGEVLGEAGLLAQGVRTASVRATTDAMVLRVTMAELDQQLHGLAPWMGRLVRTLASRFHEREQERDG